MLLGPFFQAPPPADEKGKKAAGGVACLELVMGTLLSVVLSLRPRG